MHPSGTLLIVAALVAAESAEPVRSQPPVTSWLWMCLGGLLVVLAAATISGLVAAQIRINPAAARGSLRSYSYLRAMHTSLWLAVSAVGLMALQWPQWIAGELRPRCILLDEMAVLLPVLAPMFVSYAAFYEVDQAAARAFNGGAVPTRRAGSGRWGYAWWFLRHEFGLVVVPLLVLALARDAVEACSGPAQTAPTGWAAGLAVLAIVAGFPLLLRHVWLCRPLRDDVVRQAVADECRAMGRPVPQLLEWNTQGRAAGALMTGALPQTYCVLLSDTLLRHFSHQEIMAIVRHELAHAWKHHVPLRLAALAVPILVCWNLGTWQECSTRGTAGLYAMPGGPLAAGIAILCLAAYVYYFFGAFSRLLELEADLNSCGSGQVDPQRAMAAQGALDKLGCIYGYDRRTWLHPTIRRRQHVLSTACRDPSISDQIRQQARRWRLGVAVVFATLLVLAAVQGPL